MCTEFVAVKMCLTICQSTSPSDDLPSYPSASWVWIKSMTVTFWDVLFAIITPALYRWSIDSNHDNRLCCCGPKHLYGELIKFVCLAAERWWCHQEQGRRCQGCHHRWVHHATSIYCCIQQNESTSWENNLNMSLWSIIRQRLERWFTLVQKILQRWNLWAIIYYAILKMYLHKYSKPDEWYLQAVLRILRMLPRTQPGRWRRRARS